MTTSEAPTVTLEPVRGWVDGPLSDEGHDDHLDLVDPATARVVGRVAVAGEALVDHTVTRAAAAQPSWAALPVEERTAVLRRLADLVEEDAGALARLDAAQSGRPLLEVLEGDLPGAVASLRWFASAAETLGDTVFSRGPSHLSYGLTRPAGVGVAVLPWNFPLAMAAWKVGPALATGNALVLKPAEHTPSSAVRLARLAAEAGVPPCVLGVLTGDGRTGAALVAHPAVGAVSFTGSEAVGRRVLAACAATNLARVSLEMGGKSAHLVLPDAMALGDRLLDGLVEAGFSAGGQNCTAGSRVLVHEAVADELSAALADRVADLVVGDPLDPGTQVGPLVSAAALERVDGLVGRAVRDGATVLAGGDRPEGARGFHYRPTLLTGVAADAEIEHAELFGPVVTVSAVPDVDAAVQRANATRYGLHAGVWTRDLATAHTVAARLTAGVVSVNCYSEGDLRTPFGGLGASGHGHPEKSLRAFEQWTTRAAVWTDLAG